MAQNQFVSEMAPQPEFPALVVVSIWFGILLVGITAAAQSTLGRQHPFWDGPLVLGLRGMLVALLAASCLLLLLQAQTDLKSAVLPLAINLGTLLIVFGVPFDALWRDLRFQLRWRDYSETVRLVETGLLQPDDNGRLLLPAGYRHLSQPGGEIWVSENATAVFFATGRNSAYLYRADDRPVPPRDVDSNWGAIVRQRPHWFYCEAAP